MPGSAHYHGLAYYQESTSGTGPADAAAWVSGGTRIAPLVGSMDTSKIGPNLLDDERAYDDIFDDEPGVIGLDNPEFNFELYLETPAGSTADASQISATAQMTLFEHIMGGLHRGNTTTASGTHSLTTVEVTSVTNLEVGCHIAVALSNYTGPGGATMCHVRRVTDITSLVLTVDQAFPVAPVDTDVVNACATAYIDSSALEDSSVGPTTLSWLLSRAATGSGPNWEVLGSKAQLDSISFERDDFAKLAVSVMGGSSTTPESAPAPSWTAAPANESPFQLGRYTQFWMQDYGTTTNTVHCANAFGLEEPGVPVVRAPTITTDTAGMQGTCGYTTKRADTTAAVTLFPYSSTRWTEYLNRTLKACRIANLAAAGSGCAITMPRAEVVERPDVGDVDGAQSLTFKLKALRDTDSVATTQLWRSKFCIVWF